MKRESALSLPEFIGCLAIVAVLVLVLLRAVETRDQRALQLQRLARDRAVVVGQLLEDTNEVAAAHRWYTNQGARR